MPVLTIAPAAAGEPDPFERTLWLIRTELGGVVVTDPAASDVPRPRPASDVERTWR